MIKFLDDPAALDEHMSVYNTSCYQCDRDIDIGDDCYVDTREGKEDDIGSKEQRKKERAKVYCKYCFDEAVAQFTFEQ